MYHRDANPDSDSNVHACPDFDPIAHAHANTVAYADANGNAHPHSYSAAAARGYRNSCPNCYTHAYHRS